MASPRRPLWRVTTKRLIQREGYVKLLFQTHDEEEARADFARRVPRKGWQVTLLRGIFGVDRKVKRNEHIPRHF